MGDEEESKKKIKSIQKEIFNANAGISRWLKQPRSSEDYETRLATLESQELELLALNAQLVEELDPTDKYFEEKTIEVINEEIAKYKLKLNWGILHPGEDMPLSTEMIKAQIKSKQNNLATGTGNNSETENNSKTGESSDENSQKTSSDEKSEEERKTPKKKKKTRPRRNSSASSNGEESDGNRKTEKVRKNAENATPENKIMYDLMKMMMKKELKPQLTLPKLSLPIFSGKTEEYRNWRDTASILINDKTYNDVRKLIALKDSLRHEPLELIRNIKNVKGAYLKAWKIITSTYDNNRKLITFEVEKLFSSEKYPEMTKNVKFLHDLALNVHGNLEGIILEREETLALDEKREQKAFKKSEMKSAIGDFIFCHGITSRFDFKTALDFESFIEERKINHVSMENLINFLAKQYKKLEQSRTKINKGPHEQARDRAPIYRAYYTKEVKPKYNNRVGKGRKNTAKLMFANQRGGYSRRDGDRAVLNCILCHKTNHEIKNCFEFRRAGLQEKWDIVNKLKLCGNCLSHRKEPKGCSKPAGCTICNRYHHVALHYEKAAKPQNQLPNRKVYLNQSEKDKNTILLPTAEITLNANGNSVQTVALLDSCSEITLVTEKIASQLNANTFKKSIKLTGLKEVELAMSANAAELILDLGDEQISLEASIVPEITCFKPDIKREDCKDLLKLKLANPNFWRTQEIGLLIGAPDLNKIMKGNMTNIVITDTKLGQVISGPLKTQKAHAYLTQSSDKELIKSSELEKSSQEKMLLQFQDDEIKIPTESDEVFEEAYCEEYFVNTTEIDQDGSLIVRLPFRPDMKLGENYRTAMSRLFNLEKTLAKSESLRIAYHQAIKEMIDTNQVSVVKDRSKGLYYLPHHAIVKDSRSTKVRPVFDGSCPTSNGKSINQVLFVGKKLQSDLQLTLMRFKQRKVAITADVRKMFLMVQVNKTDRPYLRFLYRNDEERKRNDPVKEFQFNVLPFGIAPSPFLAIRSMFEVADRDSEVGVMLRKHSYVDDFLNSYNTELEAIESITKLVKVLKSGNFILHKFASNINKLTEKFSETKEETEISFDFDQPISTLGLKWIPREDCFKFTVKQQVERKNTKRTILSEIASLFDPLGALGPVLVVAKQIYQSICRLNIGWDIQVPQDIQDKWQEYRDQLPSISDISIPRWTHVTNENAKSLTLIAFADASEKACGCVVYARVETSEGVKITQVAARTKVAPLNKAITIPRLELIGAELAANLITKVALAFEIENHQDRFMCFSDSTIVLAWLKGDPFSRKCFITNRILRIKSLVNPERWFHVRTHLNPADLASRGIMPSELKEMSLWWQGPEIIYQPNFEQTLNKNEVFESNEESREKDLKVLSIKATQPYDITERFSSYNRLIRATACILRWRFKAKGELTIDELDRAEMRILRLVQATHFKEDLNRIKNKLPLRKELAVLSPFIDENQILRVRGRLQNAEISQEHKNPCILPNLFKNEENGKSKINFVALIIRQTHENLFHAGATHVVSKIRTKFWILGATNAAKFIVNRCVKCFRFRTNGKSNQIMGQLPKERVNICDVFSSVALDYFGPVTFRCELARSQRFMKSWGLVVVCNATKAIHLEAVSSYSSKSFIAALTRFVARRGLCAEIHCDFGSNFTGARNIFDREFHALIKEATPSVVHWATKNKIAFKWGTVAQPHLNGLAESGVKLAKKHLKRSFSEVTLTFEELSTALASIENCLNTRPLIPISADLDNYDFLTPAHFLINRPMQAIPESFVPDRHPLDRFDMIKKISQNYWNTFKEVYLSHLQKRYKWKEQMANLEVGALVLIKSDISPRLYWETGRVIEIHPDKDNIVRLVTFRTRSGEIKKKHVRDVLEIPLDVACTEATEKPNPILLEKQAEAQAPVLEKEIDPPKKTVHSSNHPKKVKLTSNEPRRSERLKTKRGNTLGKHFLLFATVLCCLSGVSAAKVTNMTEGGVIMTQISTLYPRYEKSVTVQINTQLDLNLEYQKMLKSTKKITEACSLYIFVPDEFKLCLNYCQKVKEWMFEMTKPMTEIQRDAALNTPEIEANSEKKRITTYTLKANPIDHEINEIEQSFLNATASVYSRNKMRLNISAMNSAYSKILQLMEKIASKFSNLRATVMSPNQLALIRFTVNSFLTEGEFPNEVTLNNVNQVMPKFFERERTLWMAYDLDTVNLRPHEEWIVTLVPDENRKVLDYNLNYAITSKIPASIPRFSNKKLMSVVQHQDIKTFDIKELNPWKANECLQQILKKQTEHRSCQWAQEEPTENEPWIEFYEDTYLFSLDEGDLPLKINCSDEIMEIRFKTGILKMNSECTVENYDLTVNSLAEFDQIPASKAEIIYFNSRFKKSLSPNPFEDVAVPAKLRHKISLGRASKKVTRNKIKHSSKVGKTKRKKTKPKKVTKVTEGSDKQPAEKVFKFTEKKLEEKIDKVTQTKLSAEKESQSSGEDSSGPAVVAAPGVALAGKTALTGTALATITGVSAAAAAGSGSNAAEIEKKIDFSTLKPEKSSPTTPKAIKSSQTTQKPDKTQSTTSSSNGKFSTTPRSTTSKTTASKGTTKVPKKSRDKEDPDADDSNEDPDDTEEEKGEDEYEEGEEEDEDESEEISEERSALTTTANPKFSFKKAAEKVNENIFNINADKIKEKTISTNNMTPQGASFKDLGKKSQVEDTEVENLISTVRASRSSFSTTPAPTAPNIFALEPKITQFLDASKGVTEIKTGIEKTVEKANEVQNWVIIMIQCVLSTLGTCGGFCLIKRCYDNLRTRPASSLSDSVQYLPARYHQ